MSTDPDRQPSDSPADRWPSPPVVAVDIVRDVHGGLPVSSKPSIEILITRIDRTDVFLRIKAQKVHAVMNGDLDREIQRLMGTIGG